MGKFTNVQILNDILLNNHRVKEEIKKEKRCLQKNEKQVFVYLIMKPKLDGNQPTGRVFIAHKIFLFSIISTYSFFR